MTPSNHESPTPVTPCAFRVSITPDEAAIESAVSQIVAGLHGPFERHPEKLPHTTHAAAWRQWFCRSLPLGMARVCELILLAQRLRGFGREWVRVNVLAPLAALNDDIVIPRPIPDRIGSIDEEISEVALAVGGALLSADRGEPLPVRATKIAAAQRELGDLLEVTR